ncbi:hypothetical protein HLK59_14195 [Streptomyces sp. S3(2020)]|uniref:hypothetical protein n=1 Tax=Streptomyces sp. S3(2020) TaxID=2732044 RepID=UPI00148904FB|nr:hypothetical protein [Streptomyces sp. S3(2020)]NNN31495.1 hypothetical protein [Streptomyces sp. S3(2020)]
MTAGWCSRTVRAAVFAAVCVLLAALGHVLMSGSDVPVWTLAAGAVATGGVGWGLAGRERGLPLIVAVVVVAQTGLHSAFSLAQSAAADTGATAHDMGAMHMGSMHMHSMDSMDMGHADHVSHSMTGSSSLGMFAAHLLAAALCGLWLAHGERAAFRILRAVAGWLAAPLRLLLAALPVTPERPRVRAHRPSSDRVPRLLLVHAITSRGPPVGTAVA